MNSKFSERCSIALNAMEDYANSLGIVGVGVYLEADANQPKDLHSSLRIVGATKCIAEDQTGYSFIPIAYSKIAESLETGLASGHITRPLITGEFGWKGSVLATCDNITIITAFSGSTEDIDLEIASVGLNSITAI